MYLYLYMYMYVNNHTCTYVNIHTFTNVNIYMCTYMSNTFEYKQLWAVNFRPVRPWKQKGRSMLMLHKIKTPKYLMFPVEYVLYLVISKFQHRFRLFPAKFLNASKIGVNQSSLSTAVYRNTYAYICIYTCVYLHIHT